MISCEYSSSDLIKTAVFSVLSTVLIVFLIFLAVWFYICKKNTSKFDLNYVNKGINNSQLNSQSNFAFDNPYFKDDENELVANTNVNQYQPKFKNKTILNDAIIFSNDQAFNNDLNNCNDKFLNKNLQLNTYLNKSSPNLSFKNNNQTHKNVKFIKKALDDNCLIKKNKNISVDLIGRDFTGLGFTICGNMKDGIYIKDVLSRGPANESKIIKPGDKLTSITISMNDMVFEDALTILSYASPYNVKLNLEQDLMTNSKKKAINLSNKKNNLKQLPQNKLYQNTILHPLYRTRSVENLIQSDKNITKINYGTTLYKNSFKKNLNNKNQLKNGYEKIINKFKKHLMQSNLDNDEIKKKNISIPLNSIEKLWKTTTSKFNLNNSNVFNHENELNAVVVGNNLAFKDDDEGEEFQKKFKLSQLSYTQNNDLFKNIIQEEASNNVSNYNQKFTNPNQLYSINLNQETMTNVNTILQNRSNVINKGKIPQPSNEFNSLISSSQLLSLPLNNVEVSDGSNQNRKDEQYANLSKINQNFIIKAQVHMDSDKMSGNDFNTSLINVNNNNNEQNILLAKNEQFMYQINSKLRSNSFNDLPNQTYLIKKHKNIDNQLYESYNKYKKNFLKRTYSLDFKFKEFELDNKVDNVLKKNLNLKNKKFKDKQADYLYQQNNINICEKNLSMNEFKSIKNILNTNSKYSSSESFFKIGCDNSSLVNESNLQIKNNSNFKFSSKDNQFFIDKKIKNNYLHINNEFENSFLLINNEQKINLKKTDSNYLLSLNNKSKSFIQHILVDQNQEGNSNIDLLSNHKIIKDVFETDSLHTLDEKKKTQILDNCIIDASTKINQNSNDLVIKIDNQLNDNSVQEINKNNEINLKNSDILENKLCKKYSLRQKKMIKNNSPFNNNINKINNNNNINNNLNYKLSLSLVPRKKLNNPHLNNQLTILHKQQHSNFNDISLDFESWSFKDSRSLNDHNLMNKI